LESESTKIETAAVFTKAKYLVYLTLFIGVIKFIITDTIAQEGLISDPSSLIILAITFSVIFFVGYKLGQARNWARYIYLFLFVVGIVDFPVLVTAEYKISPIVGIMSFCQTAVQLYVLILLFSKPSRDWFRSRTNNPQQTV
jgi:hypothetical protein